MNPGPSSSSVRALAWACACVLIAGTADAQTSPPPAAPSSAEGDATPPVAASSPAAVIRTAPAPALAPADVAPPPAVASPTLKAPSAPEPEPETSATGDHPLAFRADFRLPFVAASLLGNDGASENPFAQVPQLVLGFQIGRLSVGAGLGFTHLGSTSLGALTLNELLIAPTLTLDVFESKDRKVAFYVLGAPILGVVTESQQSAASDLGFQFALGASYALHDNFRLGMEVGPVGHFYGSTDDDTLSTISLYTALVGTFAYPR